MESMSNAPYLLDRARSGYRMGHGKILDHMYCDGLEDAYDKHLPMGTFAEDCAQSFQFTRAAQDDFAIASLERAQRAIADGTFAKEIEPVRTNGKSGPKTVLHDEQPQKAKRERGAIPEPVTAITHGRRCAIAAGVATQSGSHAEVRMSDRVSFNSFVAVVQGHGSSSLNRCESHGCLSS
jgi:acetyl-CoA C-acetyltransferase